MAQDEKREDSGGDGGLTISQGEARSNTGGTQDAAEQVNPWLIAQESLRRVLDEHSYENWFAQTRFESYRDGVMTVQVPSQFFANWLREHYEDTINEALCSVLPGYRSIRFAPSSDASRDSAAIDAASQGVAPGGQGPSRRAAASARSAVISRDNGVANKSRLTTFNDRYTFDRFVIGASNRMAYAAAKAVVESPAHAYNPLFLYGQTGLGKTHLMHAIGQELLLRDRERNVAFITSEVFTNQLVDSIAKKATPRFRARYRQADVLLIDDIHFIAGKEATQEEFFHTFNELYDMRRQIVISSDRGPKEIKDMKERLVSRFEWGLVIDMQPPDFETRTAILQNKAAEEQVTLPDEVVRYIATIVTRNIRELEGALVTVLAYSRLQHQDIDIALVDRALHDIVGHTKIKSLTYERIQKAVADHFDVRIIDLRGRSRQRQVAFPRQLAMFMCKSLIPSMTLNEIGEAFGGKDHTTVLYACQKIAVAIDRDEGLRQVISDVEKELRT